jgi:hypothetical protein
MPVTFYEEEEVERYTRLLAECYGHIADGSASEIAKTAMLEKIKTTLGWRRHPNELSCGCEAGNCICDVTN